MIDFQSVQLENKASYEAILKKHPDKSCEYSFANLYLWGRQRYAVLGGNVVYFSQFSRKSVYLFPLCEDNLTQTVEALIQDARERGIACRLTGMTESDARRLEEAFPGRFRYHIDRDAFEYVYAIEELCSLAGRKYQRKRNHLNRFLALHPNATAEPITPENTPEVCQMVADWYRLRLEQDPTQDFHMEKAAIKKALDHWQELEMEGLVLRIDGKIAAMTMGSRLSETMFDVHFEKALEQYDGAYPAINREFARYLHNKYPELTHLNREDDMGLEGLRKAKMSYNPTTLWAKYWACLLEDGYDY